MICGVNIGGKDTLEEWGLMLCNDLSIGAAVPRYRFIEIPEMSGALDLTEALTGSVPYDQRQITFTLFAVHDVIAGTRSPATEEHFQTVLARFSGFANGKRLHLYLPDNPDHYFVGRVSVGGKSGYNSGRVKVEMLADPYRIKDGETTLTVDDDDFFKTATPGALVTFDDGGDDLPMKSCVVSLVPEQDLNGYDSPWPAGGGKNKADISSATLGTCTVSGTTDEMTIAQTANYGTLTFNLKGKANTMYVFSGTLKSTSTGAQALFSVGSGNYEQVAVGASFAKQVTTDANGETYCRLRPPSGSGQTNSATFANVMIEEGAALTAYAPYSNICPISGHSGAELYRTGKNVSETSSLTSTSSGNVTANTGHFGTCKAGQTYTISFDVLEENTYAVRLRFNNGANLKSWSTGAITVGQRVSFTYTPTADGWFNFNTANPAFPASTKVFDNVQVELGSSATAYEPYQGDTYSVTFSDQGTVYGGTFDFVSGKLVIDHVLYTDSGSAGWIRNTNGSFYLLVSAATSAEQTADGCYCNYAPYAVSFTGMNVFVRPTNSTISLGSGWGEIYATADELKAAFAQNPLQIVYKLATPLEYTLSPQQIETLLGENNVWSNDGDISELIYMFTDEIIINNEGMPAIPTINASEAGPTVTLRGASHVLAAGDNRFSDFILQSGENVMQVEDPAGTLTIKYQEGML